MAEQHIIVRFTRKREVSRLRLSLAGTLLRLSGWLADCQWEDVTLEVERLSRAKPVVVRLIPREREKE